jgi:hypothetical protein
MKRRVWSVALVCLAAALIGTGVFSVAQRSSTRTTSSQLKPGAFFPTEQLWIVKDVSSAIANMAGYANGSSPVAVAAQQVTRQEGELSRFEVTPAGRSSIVIRITDHIWSPQSYVPLVSALINKRAPCDPGDASIVSALLEPTRTVIQRENARVSARLRGNMTCADAHAEAAVILGTLALREAAKTFNDPRRLISRMTAHLAFAAAMGVSEDNVTRRLAETMLYTLVGRQRSALDRLTSLDPSGSNGTMQSWIRALRMRNTGDWRIVSDPDRATLLEQIELIRAAEYSLGDPRVLDFIDAIHNRADVPDWGRLVMQESPGVEAGNRFASEAIAAEIVEAVEVRKAFAPSEALDSAEALVTALKVEPTYGPVATNGTVWIVDWATWAAIAERHLMTLLNDRDTHITNVLGNPAAGKAYREQVARTFAGLRLYPLTAINLAATKEEARPGMAGSLTLLQTHPELVTHWNWKSVLMKETWAALPARVPRIESWFTPEFLPGTVFDGNTRPWDAHLVSKFSAAEIAPYRQAAPYSRPLPYVTIGPKYETAPASVLEREFGDMAQYNLGFAIRIANALKDNPDAYLSAMQPVIRMSPERLLDVAEYEVQQDRLDEARSTYERWFATGRDDVAIANASEWMVRDYYVRGLSAKANALADRAASTGSYWGLLTRARLFDWTGNARSAERYFRHASEGYQDPSDLLGFMLRHHRQGMEIDALKWKVFPGGVTSVSLPTLRDAPVSGLEVIGVKTIGERYGMRQDDIIVAVDGVRVNSLDQYHAAKTMSLDPTMRLIVWRDLKYREVAGPIRYGGIWGYVKEYGPGTRKPDKAPPRRW